MKHGTGMATILCAAAASGCGVNIVAHKAGPLQTEMAAPGIYYMLPKTEVHLAIPAVVGQLQAGHVGAVFDDCLAACRKTSEKETAEACKLPGTWTLKLLRPQVTLRGVPDPAQAYYVTATSEMFSSVKHAMEFGENGVVTQASSSATNMAYEVVSGVFEKVIALVPFKAAPRGGAASEPERLSCADARKIDGQLKKFDDEIAQEHARLDSWLSPTAKPVEAKFAKLLIARSADRVAAIRERLAKYRSEVDLEVVRKTHHYQLNSATPIVPAEFEADPKKEFVIKEESPVDEAAAQSPLVEGILKQLQVKIHTELKMEAAKPPCQSGQCGLVDATAGYRYRMPAMGRLIVQVSSPNPKGGPAIDKKIFDDLVPIAQYGAIVALPGRYEGKSGSVEVSLSPVTGTLKKVAIGSEALPSTAVTAPLETIRAAAEARQKKKDDAAKEAASADKTALERERDLLQLQKEIRELKQDLGQ